MFEAILTITLDLATRLRELGIIPKGIKRATAFCDEKGNVKDNMINFNHMVTRIDMKDGVSYILDMTGAQYGWPEPILNFTDFNENRVKSYDNPGADGQDFGVARSMLSSMNDYFQAGRT